MARVLVTGGAGFIGSHLVQRLTARGDQVTVLDDLSTGRRANLDQLGLTATLVEGSVLDAALVDRLVGEAERVFHLAAAVGVDYVLRHPLRSLQTNIGGTECVLAACDRYEQPILLASTSEVYGKNDRDGLSEEDDRVLGAARLSRWFYAAAKSIDESLALAYWQERRLPVVIVRFFNTIGPRQSSQYGSVVPRFVRWALRDEPLIVYGDGLQTRCFTDVRDTVCGVLKLTDVPDAAGEVFNIGQPTEVRIVDLARRVIELTGSRSQIRLVPYDDAAAYAERAAGYEDMRRRVPDASKLQRYTGFRPSIPLDETLRSVIAYERTRDEPPCAASAAS
jgi:UDP-glucose 4-epimerase